MLTPFDSSSSCSPNIRATASSSLQEQNTEYGYSTRELFNDDEEYRFSDGKVRPTGRAAEAHGPGQQLPRPRMWELSASDSVGEMWHAG